MSLKGKSLLGTPWIERREILRRVLPSNPLFRLSDSFDTGGATISRTVREFNLEGAIAKRRTSFYEPGKRSGAWIKQRIYQEREFVVGAGHARRGCIDILACQADGGDDRS